MSSSDSKATLQRELKSAAKKLGLSAGAGWLADATTETFVYLHYEIDKKADAEGRLTMWWTVFAKPMGVDSQTWFTLFPDNPMGTAAKRIALRSEGAFAVRGLEVQSGSSQFSSSDDASEWAHSEAAAFQTRAAQFTSDTPDATAFLAVIDEAKSARPDLPWWHTLLRALTLTASGKMDEAGALAHAAVDAGEGYFTVDNTTIWQMLARDYDATSGVFAPDYVPQIP